MTKVVNQGRASWRDVLPVHPAADLFPMMSDDELKALGQDIKQNGLRSRIVLWDSGSIDKKGKVYLLDGRNRLAAMEAVGIDIFDSGKIEPLINGRRRRGSSTTEYGIDYSMEGVLGGRMKNVHRPGTDPYAMVVSANIHRRHLTAEQRRELIAKLLKADPNKSDRQIAETVKVSPTTVGTVRAKMEKSGDVSNLDTRTDTRGREQPARKGSRKVFAKHRASKPATAATVSTLATAVGAKLNPIGSRALAEFKVAVDIWFAKMTSADRLAAVQYVTAMATKRSGDTV